jgi:dipeptidyl aminopeptidase/acylaminoacyl peptidase
MPALPGQVLYADTHIILFDANQKRITKNLEGDFANINWSPDGRYILYKTPMADDQGYSPKTCVLDVQIDRRRCFGTIANQTIDAYNSDFEWLPDSSGLVYLKQANSGEYNHFCIYKFQEDRVDCPSQDVSQINNRKIIQYSLSPDGRFVFLTSDTAYSSFDAPERPISAWMQADGQMYSELWGEGDFQTFGWNPAAVGVLWRPAVQPTGSINSSSEAAS